MGAKLSAACCCCLKKDGTPLTDIEGNAINLREEFEQFNEEEPLLNEPDPRTHPKKVADKKAKRKSQM